jgi:hypothetical protein
MINVELNPKNGLVDDVDLIDSLHTHSNDQSWVQMGKAGGDVSSRRRPPVSS